MAYKIVVSENFEATTAQTIHWLQQEWSAKSADKFQQKLKNTISKISETPFAGRKSVHHENVRSFQVTRHNRIYYSISDNLITLLELFETKQSPNRNKFD